MAIVSRYTRYYTDLFIWKITSMTQPSASQDELNAILSESRHPDSMNLDTLSTSEILTLINREDQRVASTICSVIPQITQAVDAIVIRLKQGGRLLYCGAGTSGRMGIIDAVECRPTFSVPDTMIQACIAGGESAFISAAEGAEDDPKLAIHDLAGKHITDKDCVVSIAASGRTPYALSALQYAKQKQALTISISNNPNGIINSLAQHVICAPVGPEVVTGSTRMKAGTSQKLILNMISTTVMVKLGKVYQNLMVDVNASNAKLVARAKRIVMQATQCSEDVASEALIAADHSAKLAILMVHSGLESTTARTLLDEHHGFLRAALESPTNVQKD